MPEVAMYRPETDSSIGGSQLLTVAVGADSQAPTDHGRESVAVHCIGGLLSLAGTAVTVSFSRNNNPPQRPCDRGAAPAIGASLKRASGGTDEPVIRSERDGPLQAGSVVNWFAALYRTLGLAGCSSHSGRRTFITNAARRVHRAGGSLRDVQELAGHRSLAMTQRYIDGDSDAKRRLVALL